MEETAALVAAVERGDVEAAVNAYADGARIVAAGSLVEGRREIEAYWRAGIDLGVVTVAFERQTLEDVTHGVLEVGRYVVRGDRFDHGTYLVLHTRDSDGSWRRAVEVFNADEPAPGRRELHEEES